MRNGSLLICAECQRLWSHYQRATRAHQNLLSRLKTESASVDKGGAALLIQQLNSAELARKKAKDVLETHQLAAGHD
jgi:hypothetical protein